MSTPHTPHREEQNSEHNLAGDSGLLTAYRLPGYNRYPRIVPAAADRWWMDFSTKGWANRCLPLRIANQNGWFILNDAEFEATWSGKNQLDSVKITTKDNSPPPFVNSMFGYGILTWTVPFVFRTASGIDLIARGPTNMPKDGIVALEGEVEADWLPFPFTMNWRFTRPFKKVKFERDEPICMITPIRRADVETYTPVIRNMESDPALLDQYQAWYQHRRQAMENVRLGRTGQGHYTRGEGHLGESAHGHRTKIGIKPFIEEEPPLSVASTDNGNAEPVKPRSRLSRLLGRLGGGR